jgi:hypothetical protein
MKGHMQALASKLENVECTLEKLSELHGHGACAKKTPICDPITQTSSIIDHLPPGVAFRRCEDVVPCAFYDPKRGCLNPCLSRFRLASVGGWWHLSCWCFGISSISFRRTLDCLSFSDQGNSAPDIDSIDINIHSLRQPVPKLSAEVIIDQSATGNRAFFDTILSAVLVPRGLLISTDDDDTM